MTEHARTTSAPAAPALLKLLQAQTAVYERIAAQHDQQRALIDADDHQQLADLMQARQKLVDRALQLNEAIAPYREQWSQFYAAQSEQDRSQIETLVRRLAHLQQEVLKQDAEVAAAVRKARDALNGQRRQVVSGSRALSAYRLQTKTNHRYTDRQG